MTEPIYGQLASAVNLHGDAHFFVVQRAQALLHMTRHVENTWKLQSQDIRREIRILSNPSRLLDKAPAMAIKFVACTQHLNGGLHLFVLDQNHDLWTTVRADGRWLTDWKHVQPVFSDAGDPDIGPVQFVATALAANDDILLFAFDQNNGLWYTVRRSDGSWPLPWESVQQANHKADNSDVGAANFVSCATTGNGDVHLFVLDVNHTLWHAMRQSDGRWPLPWLDVQQEIRKRGNADIGQTKLVATAPVANGDIHLFALDQNNNLWHTVRRADGSWPLPWENAQQKIREHSQSDIGPIRTVTCSPLANGNIELLVLDQSGRLWGTTHFADGTWPIIWLDTEWIAHPPRADSPRTVPPPAGRRVDPPSPETSNNPPPSPTPKIEAFAAAPDYINVGDSTTLNWQITNCTEECKIVLQGHDGLNYSHQNLNMADLSATGSTKVTPAMTFTRYTLTVTSPQGTDSKNLRVQLYAPLTGSSPNGTPFYFKLTKPDGYPACLTLAANAPDGKVETVKRAVEAQYDGYKVEEIKESQFLTACQ